MNVSTNERPFRGDYWGVYWNGGGWYAAPYTSDGVSHHQQTGTQTLAQANQEAEEAEAEAEETAKGGQS